MAKFEDKRYQDSVEAMNRLQEEYRGEQANYSQVAEDNTGDRGLEKSQKNANDIAQQYAMQAGQTAGAQAAGAARTAGLSKGKSVALGASAAANAAANAYSSGYGTGLNAAQNAQNSALSAAQQRANNKQTETQTTLAQQGNAIQMDQAQMDNTRKNWETGANIGKAAAGGVSDLLTSDEREKEIHSRTDISARCDELIARLRGEL